MDESKVARAAIESAVKNFSDGVIAPGCCFLVAGLPGPLFYKCVNTADYRDFGWASVQLTSLLITPTGSVLGRLHSINIDAKIPYSPFAGWTVATMG